MRLIDADELISVLKELEQGVLKSNCTITYYVLTQMEEVINMQPTAYDKDKVLQLIGRTAIIPRAQAIEIVEGGGVDETQSKEEEK